MQKPFKVNDHLSQPGMKSYLIDFYRKLTLVSVKPHDAVWDPAEEFQSTHDG